MIVETFNNSTHNQISNVVDELKLIAFNSIN